MTMSFCRPSVFSRRTTDPSFACRVVPRAGALALACSLTVALGCEPASDKTDIPNGPSAGGSAGSGSSGSGGVGGSSTGAGPGSGGSGMATAGSGGGETMGGAGGGGAPPSAGPGIPLPMVVTTHYENQGWFGDSVVAAAFAPGAAVIKQEPSAEGPCAARAENARGKCLKIIYTPPPGVMPPPLPGGPYVGVFMLTTLLMPHPELTPPGMIGDANWGAEPGKVIAPGAAAITFSAAADTAGTAVTFKAGVMTDPFAIPEKTEMLGTSWQPYSLSLAGQSYEGGVVGAFAWVLQDTSQPATFYLDNIVWE